MTRVKLYLLKSHCENIYIYTNENYIELNENSQNLYNDNMKLIRYKFCLKYKKVAKIFITNFVIDIYGEILFNIQYI